MRLILLLFDSLNCRAPQSYGGTRVKTPNFTRLALLAERAVSFDRHYVGSMPCMPARRDLHTGRLNFLHRSWGPLEPFDNSFPVLLRRAGIYSRLVSDHYHYFEDAAGATTSATASGTSCVARKPTSGRPWCSRRSSASPRSITRRNTRPIRTACASSTWSTANRSATSATFRPSSASSVPSRSSTTIEMPTTGWCSSRPSIRTSRSPRRPVFVRTIRPITGGPSSTGRAIAG